jgi:hypothetical protein
MATADVQHATPATFGGRVDVQENLIHASTPLPHNVHTVLNYYKDPADGSSPPATYVDRPETYNRPSEAHPVTVHDVSGHEAEFTLDGNGFQFHRHTATEQNFVDDEQIRSSYYPETEQLLKDMYVAILDPVGVTSAH